MLNLFIVRTAETGRRWEKGMDRPTPPSDNQVFVEAADFGDAERAYRSRNPNGRPPVSIRRAGQNAETYFRAFRAMYAGPEGTAKVPPKPY